MYQNTRLFMWREEDRVGDDDVQTRRFLRVVFAPHLPDSSFEFVIRREGLFGSASVSYCTSLDRVYSIDLQIRAGLWSRYETTGIRPEYLRDRIPVRQVGRKIQDYLCNGEPIWQIRSRTGKARILFGHDLEHDLKCLGFEYPEFFIRDTANIRHLVSADNVSA
ncbi:hypothetical protein SASPL_129887 [Salvia splendens]|uniref:Exonuclease domain-containing protein n=1 Tax=Salvia splendens TaxID=180675 RepID=A0A8X8XE54_SALSN|nr:hypothetical protein SASPL_129887 [Salvia splendens]